MNIALVGFTSSYNDQQWLEMARAWAAEHDPQHPWTHATQHIFDLRGGQGRNFLDDPGQYDIVILFAIYNPPAESKEFRKSLGRRTGQTSLAINHSRNNWATRLSRSAARFLFIFRRPDSVSGEWLGEIEGYEKKPEQSGEFGVSVYWRKAIAEGTGQISALGDDDGNTERHL